MLNTAKKLELVKYPAETEENIVSDIRNDVGEIKLIPDYLQSPINLIGDGGSLLEQGDISGAYSKYSQAIENCSDVPEFLWRKASAYFGLAKCYAMRGNKEKAYKALDDANEVDNSNADTLKQQIDELLANN